MPDDFDPRGASIGNLILVGGYLVNHRDLSSVVFLFSRLVEARGQVSPSCAASHHLGARFRNGKRLIRQHLISAKEAPAIDSRVERLFLAHSADDPTEVRPRTEATVIDAIRRAELVCFSMGSFYSSLVANLLPEGACDALADNPCPKVYVPNTGTDPEQLGLSVDACIRTLVRYLRGGCSDQRSHALRLTHLIVDDNRAHYGAGLADDVGVHEGIEVVRAKLVTADSTPSIAPERFLEAVLSLA